MEIQNLEKTFDNFSLKRISFNVPKGYIMGFIGPNGAGKSTTIKLIMNLLHKDAGDIKIFGLDHIKNEIDIKNRIGFVYDENHYYEELTIKELAKMLSRLYLQWDNKIFSNYLETFNLAQNMKIKKLSKGQKMKFSLAVALSHHAELLILDEPTSGLDPLIRSELLDLLSSLIQDENKAVFFSTHILTDLDRIADYITFINHGEIVVSDTKDRILESYELIKGDTGLLQNLDKSNLIGIKETDYGFTALVNKDSDLSPSTKSNLVIERPTLEDIMLYTARRNMYV